MVRCRVRNLKGQSVLGESNLKGQVDIGIKEFNGVEEGGALKSQLENGQAKRTGTGGWIEEGGLNCK